MQRKTFKLSRKIVAGWNRHLPAELWAALQMPRIDFTTAAAIRLSLGELPRRWQWPENWFDDSTGSIFAECSAEPSHTPVEIE